MEKVIFKMLGKFTSPDTKDLKNVYFNLKEKKAYSSDARVALVCYLDSAIDSEKEYLIDSTTMLNCDFKILKNDIKIGMNKIYPTQTKVKFPDIDRVIPKSFTNNFEIGVNKNLFGQYPINVIQAVLVKYNIYCNYDYIKEIVPLIECSHRTILRFNSRKLPIILEFLDKEEKKKAIYLIMPIVWSDIEKNYIDLDEQTKKENKNEKPM